jgi:saccharopine dehydrogenase (NAD+, L-lysine forming)
MTSNSRKLELLWSQKTWREAPTDHIIIGLKELPVEECMSFLPNQYIRILANVELVPLKHVHVQFAHCYKNQGGWEKVLSRFPRGGGTLLDLEFLTDDRGRRVAVVYHPHHKTSPDVTNNGQFGYHAGFAGAALALETWAWQLTHPASEPFPSVSSYPNEDALIADVKKAIAAGKEKSGKDPRVLVIGALGRCGGGAVDFCLRAGVPTENVLKWDLAETAKGGPFPEIVESEIFVNCIYLMSKIPNFVDLQSLDTPTASSQSSAMSAPTPPTRITQFRYTLLPQHSRNLLCLLRSRKSQN